VKARRRSKDSCDDAATELSLIESSNQKVSDVRTAKNTGTTLEK
jgi:hypothetical protein